MNQSSEQTFSDVMGISAAQSYQVFAWFLVITLGVALMILVINILKKHGEDDIKELEIFTTIGRMLFLILLLFVFFL